MKLINKELIMSMPKYRCKGKITLSNNIFKHIVVKCVIQGYNRYNKKFNYGNNIINFCIDFKNIKFNYKEEHIQICIL